MNKVPPLDLTQQFKLIQDEVNAAVLEVLASGAYIGGANVDRFEQGFAEYIGVSEAISCNSGTDALYLALRVLNLQPGDEVITTPFTFIATAETISAVGATPVFVDIEPATFNLDLEQVEAAITPRTRAIIPVHLFGLPVNMTRLMAIAQNYNLAVIEDCAQATGATWDGKKVGSIGLMGCFSFFPTKNLGACGDGGAVTTNDPALAALIRVIKGHGQSSRYCSEEIGINSRLDALQAAILNIKLRYLETWNQQRCQVAKRYHQLLSAVPHLILPQFGSQGQSVWNQYTIRLRATEGKSSHQPLFREQVREQLQQRWISSMVYYPIPLHLQPIYQNLGYQVGQFPQAEQAAQEVLSLPMFPELTAEQQDQVIYSLKDCLTAALTENMGTSPVL